MSTPFPYLPSGVNFVPEISGSMTLGTNDMPFSGLYVSNINATSINNATFVFNKFMEEPLGAANGVNTDFTLTYSPYGNSLILNKNGLLMLASGVHSTAADYTLSGNTISFFTPPVSGTIIIASSYGYLI